MKNPRSFIILNVFQDPHYLLYACALLACATGTALANVSVQVKQPINEIRLQLSEELRVKKESNTLTQEELANMQSISDSFHKAISEATPAIKFSKTVYSPTEPGMYLGADNTVANPGTYALTKISASQATRTLTPVAMAPASVTLDGSAGTDNNPINDMIPTAITMMNGYPVVAIDPTNLVGHTADDGKNRIVLVTDTAAGATVFSNATDAIKDAATPVAPLKDADVITAMTADPATKTIFAAVPPQGAAFGTAGSGIVRLKQKTAGGELGVVDLADGANFNGAAYKIDLTAGTAAEYPNTDNNTTSVNFAFGTATGVINSPIVDLFWSQSMQGFYIGLTGATGTAQPGTIISTLYGYVTSDGLLRCYAITNPNVVQNVGNRIMTNGIAYYDAAAASVPLSAFKVRTMQTSTGRDYIIINGGVAATTGGANALKQKIFAFPIVPVSDTENAGMIAGDPTTKATPADKAKPFTVAKDDGTDFPKTDQAYAMVGGTGTIPGTATTDVKDMYVVGDTVYIAISGARTDATTDAGIFASTALFDQYGNITAWTPWQRVAGSTDAVYGFGVDASTNNFMYLTDTAGTANSQDTIKSTMWGSSSDVKNTPVDLSGALATAFPATKGGVQSLSSFGSTGAAALGFNNTSLMVATGLDTVALVEAGKKDTTNDFIKLPAAAFTAGTNIRIDTSAAIQAIGPVCTATMSNSNVADKIWLFVGGYNGVAVLAQNNGKGAGVALTGLAPIINPATFAFQKITPPAGVDFTRTRKLMSDGITDPYLYVMTQNALYALEMKEANLTPAVCATPFTGSYDTYTIAGVTLSDFVLVGAGTNTIALIATSGGLYSYDLTTAGAAPTLVDPTNTTPVTQLLFIPATNDALPTAGNLYALAADMKNSSAKIYRYSVAAGVPTAIDQYDSAGNAQGTKGLVGDLGMFRGNIAVDGSFIYDVCGKHLGSTDYLDLAAVKPITTTGSIPLSSVGLTSALNIDTDTNTNVGMMIRDKASGAWVLPGDFGVRVNQ